MNQPLSQAALCTFTRLLREGSGLSIGEEKVYLLRARLTPLLRRFNLPDLEALARKLAEPGQGSLARVVIEAMTTNESRFFRDMVPFDHLRDYALPRLDAARPAGVAIRLWSAGSSAGQEAYSLAMLAVGMRYAAPERRFEIVGTDIARTPLARASAGAFSEFEIGRGLPAELRQRHFARHGNDWVIDPELRGMVMFRDHNLLASPAPLGRFDVVFCRNVLIYFDTTTRCRVLDGIAEQLAPDGLLYLGIGETLVGVSGRFFELPGERGIYMRERRTASVEPASRGNRPQALDAPSAHADIPVVTIDRRIAVSGHQKQLLA